MRYAELIEKWSKKYKSSINCNNPKGFSQKAHCAGKKKNESLEEGKRIARKKGQKANSKKHSDLYTDENPKGTIHGLKFATVKDAEASVSKIRSSGKKHAHKIQAAVAMEQRAKAAGKSSAAAVYRKYINAMKKKTKAKNESLNESEMNDLGYFNKEQLEKSIEEVEAYKEYHIENGWQNIELENPPDNDSKVTRDELVTITNIQAKRTKEDENSIYVSDKMDSFHFREYLNANNLDYSSAEITAIIDDVWKVTRTFKNKFNRPRPYQMAEAYNMEFETMHGTSNKTPSYPSGHSCGATLLALYLSKKHPEHKEQFKDIAEKIGVGRIQAGFHYPSDHVSGVDLAFKVFPYLKISQQHLKESEQKDITAQELQQLETYADRLFASLGIDIEFSKHFKDRLNDPRNKKPITMAELTRLFRQVYKQHGKPIAQLGPDAEAVMKDMRTDVNIPFTLQWDGKELDLVAKTIMRKPHFSTPNQEFAVENFADGKKKGKSRPGRVKRAGASCKGSVTSLRAKAKKSSGEKAKMYHWCANMKSGRNK